MNYIKTKVKAVIFDLDGTIVNTEHLWELGTCNYLEKKGISVSKESKILASFSGKGLIQCAKEIKNCFNLKDSIEDIVKGNHQEVLLLFEKGIELIDGFEMFHKELLDHQVTHAIATNADDVSLKYIKACSNLDRFFSTNIFNVNMVTNPKPHPELFLYAAKQLGVDPKDCIIFEDSGIGLTAAKAAGMKSVMIKNKQNYQHSSLASTAINSYHEAIEAIKKLL